jgi:hypothetical protein
MLAAKEANMEAPRPVNPAYRTFVSYIDKSREFYAAQGFTEPYRWACFADVPFTPLARPLRSSVVTLITTASPEWDGPAAERPPNGVYSMDSADPPARLFTDNRFWDKQATHTKDLDSYFPIHRLQELAAEGELILAPRCHGVPTEYSQRLTMEVDAPEVLSRCREDNVDAAILVPL